MTEKNRKIIELLKKFEKEYDEKDALHYRNGDDYHSDIAMHKAYICYKLRKKILLSEDSDPFDVLKDIICAYANMIDKDIKENRRKELLYDHIRLLDSCEVIRKRLMRLIKTTKTEA